jgi:hypothetical protein
MALGGERKRKVEKTEDTEETRVGDPGLEHRGHSDSIAAGGERKRKVEKTEYTAVRKMARSWTRASLKQQEQPLHVV